MPTPCFWIEPTGDALVEFKDGRPPEVHPSEAHGEVLGWSSWGNRYRRPDTGEVRNGIREFGPGAMWDAHWFSDSGWYAKAGPDGRVLCVTLPNGSDWVIDSRASNCTEPCRKCGVPYADHGVPAGGERKDRSQGTCPDGGSYEPADGGAHRCWVRHGDPPKVTVDKSGLTCKAGAGSIQSGNYHGHLVDGVLTDGT